MPPTSTVVLLRNSGLPLTEKLTTKFVRIELDTSARLQPESPETWAEPRRARALAKVKARWTEKEFDIEKAKGNH